MALYKDKGTHKTMCHGRWNIQTIPRIVDLLPKSVQFDGLTEDQINCYLKKLGFTPHVGGRVLTKKVNDKTVAVTAAGVFSSWYSGRSAVSWRPPYQPRNAVLDMVKSADVRFFLIVHDVCVPNAFKGHGFAQIADKIIPEELPWIPIRGGHCTLVELKTNTWTYYDCNQFDITWPECIKHNETVRTGMIPGLAKWMNVSNFPVNVFSAAKPMPIKNGCTLYPLWFIEQRLKCSNNLEPYKNDWIMLLSAYKIIAFVGGHDLKSNMSSKRTNWRFDVPIWPYQDLLDRVERANNDMSPMQFRKALDKAYAEFMEKMPIK